VTPRLYENLLIIREWDALQVTLVFMSLFAGIFITFWGLYGAHQASKESYRWKECLLSFFVGLAGCFPLAFGLVMVSLYTYSRVWFDG
jgi:NhaP-type Na+/H+ or K+/H+ antiporter